jgi:hypothetical protein
VTDSEECCVNLKSRASQTWMVDHSTWPLHAIKRQGKHKTYEAAAHITQHIVLQ